MAPHFTAVLSQSLESFEFQPALSSLRFVIPDAAETLTGIRIEGAERTHSFEEFATKYGTLTLHR